MRLPGEPECYIMQVHVYAPFNAARRERWFFEIPAGRLCDTDIGSMLAVTSPSDRMVQLLGLHLIERTVMERWDDEPQRLIVLETDDGDWEMRLDRNVWLAGNPATTRGQTIRWPTDDTELRWTTEKPS